MHTTSRIARWASSGAVGLLLIAGPAVAAPGDDPASTTPSASSAPSETSGPQTSGSAASSASSATSSPSGQNQQAQYCKNPPASSATIEEVPWQVSSYSAPERIWPFTTGTGITVAVLSTGVQADHPQLAGSVLRGRDFAAGANRADDDCLGSGTAVASVIAGKKVDGVGFYGLAPGVSILPVRVSQALSSDDESKPEPQAGAVAAGINYAVESGAAVIVVPHAVYLASPELEAAVAQAVAAGVVVVAAVGDQHSPEAPPMTPTPDSLTPYPAAYPQVLGVGMVGPDGMRGAASQIGPYVDLVAPGVDVVAAAIDGQEVWVSTQIASGYVAATAALVLADPRTGIAGLPADQRANAVIARIVATTAPDGVPDPNMGYGSGIVDPYRALNEPMADSGPVPPNAPQPYQPSESEIQAARDERNARTLLNYIGGGAVLATLGGGFAIWAIRRTRRLGAGAATTPRPASADEAPAEYVAGEALFTPKQLD